MTSTLKLLALFAHPDDEAFGTGGTLSKYAAEGVAVHLIMATSGEAGQSSDPKLATPETLSQAREQELLNACRAYSINPPHLLRYPDGQMTIVNQKEAVGQVVEIIRRLKPQVMLTFGPDGVYGHYDHLACHRWAVVAFRLAADPEWFPEQVAAGLEPHTISKLYYRATTQSWIEQIRQNGRGDVMMDGIPFSFFGYDDSQVTTKINITAYAHHKQKGILCHASQIQDTSPFVGEEALNRDIFQGETFIRVQSLVAVPAGIEDDFFAGLRS